MHHLGTEYFYRHVTAISQNMTESDQMSLLLTYSRDRLFIIVVITVIIIIIIIIIIPIIMIIARVSQVF